jgi:hypothetical protein
MIVSYLSNKAGGTPGLRAARQKIRISPSLHSPRKSASNCSVMTRSFCMISALAIAMRCESMLTRKMTPANDRITARIPRATTTSMSVNAFRIALLRIGEPAGK